MSEGMDPQRKADLARAAQLRDEVMRGLQLGEPAERLLLKAIESMSLLDNDTVSPVEAKKTMTAIYGDALGRPEPLKIELEEYKARRERIQASYDRGQDVEEPDTLSRMQSALRAHDQRIAYLEEQLAQ